MLSINPSLEIHKNQELAGSPSFLGTVPDELPNNVHSIEVLARQGSLEVRPLQTTEVGRVRYFVNKKVALVPLMSPSGIGFTSEESRNWRS
ncbi:hypothetical protein Tco_1056207 [Tanacetum coccineum]|uniref:Uncharacterized protein n=1 Tax=Tanacetum coccineum TaxID=301880 RepID=A0ABQ5H2I5_9ASTR